MARKNIKTKKRISILSHGLRNLRYKGDYFNIKINDSSSYISQIRLESENNLKFLLENLVNNSLPIRLPGYNKPNVTELNKSILTFIDFDNEFYWAKNIIFKYYQKINYFLDLTENYSNYILSEKFEDAHEILNAVENNFGQSIWLIKNRTALLQISKGLEEQKKFSNGIKLKCSPGSLLRFLIHQISIRNENQTSISRYKGQLDIILDKLDDKKQKGYKEYLNFHLQNIGSNDPESMIQVLRLSFSDNIIDYYYSFLNLLNSMYVSQNELYLAKARSVVLIFSDKIKDQRLLLLSSLLLKTPFSVCQNIDSVKLFDEILKTHKIRPSSSEFRSGILSKPIDLMLNALILTHNIELNNENIEENKVYDKVLFGLVKLFRSGFTDINKEIGELSKLALNFEYCEWAALIKQIIHGERLPEVDSKDSNYVNLLNFQFIHPFFIDTIDSFELKEDYLDLCLKAYPETPSVKYFEAKVLRDPNFFNENISDNYSELLKADNFFFTNEFETSIIHALKFFRDKNSFFARRGYYYLSNSYFEIKDLRNSIITSADGYLLDKNYLYFLPIERLVKLIFPGSNNWRLVNDLIEFSIVQDICFKHLNKSYEIHRRFAYEDYLLGIGVDRPSGLRNVANKIDFNKLVYYLRYLCSESIMDTSSAFSEGSKLVIEERLIVCKFLLDFDSNNSEGYNEEIKQIVRRQIIAERRQEVDQSRIYVDVNSIKEWCHSELKDSFDRYKEYLKIGIDVKPKNLIIGRNSSSVLDTPENEAASLLLEIIDEIKNVYLSSDMGLDRFISTRIRHGELERAMRVPIQNYNLITKRTSKVGPYKSNTHWLNNISGNEEHQILDNIFKEFSEKFDSLISKIANDWLQIHKPEKPNGLFDFRWYDVNINRIFESAKLETSLKEFVDTTINVLESILIVRLVEVREALTKDAKKEAKDLIGELLKEIVEENHLDYSDLKQAIGLARGELFVQIDKISEWFFPSVQGNSAPFYIYDAVAVAEAIIKEGVPNFNLNQHVDDKDALEIHGSLPMIIDIFVNIFDNVVKRSGLENREAEVDISYEIFLQRVTSVNLKIVNNLGDSIDRKGLESKIIRIKSNLQESNYSEFLAKEGNSGLLKIHKSVNEYRVQSENIEPNMDFNLINDQFEILLKIPFDIIQFAE